MTLKRVLSMSTVAGLVVPGGTEFAFTDEFFRSFHEGSGTQTRTYVADFPGTDAQKVFGTDGSDNSILRLSADGEYLLMDRTPRRGCRPMPKAPHGSCPAPEI